MGTGGQWIKAETGKSLVLPFLPRVHHSPSVQSEVKVIEQQRLKVGLALFTSVSKDICGKKHFLCASQRISLCGNLVFCRRRALVLLRGSQCRPASSCIWLRGSVPPTPASGSNALETVPWQVGHLQDVITGTPNSPRFIFVKRARVDVPKQLLSHQQVRYKDNNAHKIPRKLLEDGLSERKQLRFIRWWDSLALAGRSPGAQA